MNDEIKKVDLKNLKISGTLKSREDLSNPFRGRDLMELLIEKGDAIDLRDNHTIEHLPGGYIQIHPIDPSKVFTKDSPPLYPPKKKRKK